MKDSNHYFECHCHSPEHLLKFVLWEDDPMLFAYVFLNPEPFYKRIWLGIKYIFGYSSRYGYFDEFILNPKDADRFIEILNRYKECAK
jgi:hypothetical protein